MKRTARIVRGMLLLLAAALLFLASAGAEGLPEPYIQDDADLLTDAEEEALREQMRPLCEFGTPLFWTTESPGNYETMAEQFYHGRLRKGESGVLFVINMYARQLRIFSDGAVYRTVTSAEADTIADNVFRMATRGEYYACASETFAQIGKLLRGERIARPMKAVSNALLAVALALMCMYLFLSMRYESRPKIGIRRAALPVTAAGAAAFAASLTNAHSKMTKRSKTSIRSSSGGGGGGGFSGGGGGGSSGGGGGHGF